MKIPRVFHRIWVGSNPMPDEFARFGETWRHHHPNWTLNLWTDARLPRLINRNEFEKAKNAAQKADILKYELIYRFGGVYLDTDFECLKNLESLLSDVEAFAARESDEFIAVGIFGAIPGHPLLRDVVRALPEFFRREIPGRQDLSTGPGLMTEMAKRHPELVVFGPELFYPYHFTEKHRRWEKFPAAYAVHHWAFSWAADSDESSIKDSKAEPASSESLVRNPIVPPALVASRLARLARRGLDPRFVLVALVLLVLVCSARSCPAAQGRPIGRSFSVFCCGDPELGITVDTFTSGPSP